MKRTFSIRFSFLSLLIVLLSLISCKDKKFKKVDSGFSNFITYYSSGLLSAKSKIKVRFTKKQEIIIGEAADDLFSFSPKIAGKAYWKDYRTVVFEPNKDLLSGEIYDVDFNIGKVQDVPKEFDKLNFNFQVIPQHFDVSFSGFSSVDSSKLNFQNVIGTINTSDVITLNELEQVFKAELNGENYPIVFKEINSKRFNFYVNKVPRKESKDKLKLNWNAKKLNIEEVGKLDIPIPALDDFSVIQARVINEPQQHISIIFSDPVKTNQNLKGLISIKGAKKPSFIIDGNEIKMYPGVTFKQTKDIWINGVKNLAGRKLKKQSKFSLTFVSSKPALEILGEGIILPNNEGIKFPFKAISLRSVKVKVIRIFEENVAQFLQVNEIDGERELKRVGRVVYKKTVDLQSDKKIDYNDWNTFALQLDELIDPEPGAIYRVELSFTKSNSFYLCKDTTVAEEEVSNDDNWEEASDEEENSFWDGYEDDYGGRRFDYDQRNNPCNDAYYYYTAKAKVRNVLASNLGVVAKLGQDNTFVGLVTDLRTTQPISGVDLKLINYQQQEIGRTTTDKDGIAKVSYKKDLPFLLIASNGLDKGYVRLDNNSSLSTSKFDVDGEVVQKGIKGFIYGERGVWRPGDSLYLNFMLQDKDKLLPENHPIKFELLNPSGQIVDTQVKTNGFGAIYNFNTSTSTDDQTGNWLARVQVGGTVFSKKIKIETVKPNRLKVNLDFGKDKLSVKDKTVKGTLKSKWLHGAIAKNLKADAKVSLSATKTKFKKYKDYIFDDPARKFESSEQKIFDGHLNDLGEGEISANIKNTKTSPGMLNANFLVRVFEEGGDYSVDRFTIPYAPYKSFAGIKLPKGDVSRGMLLTDVKHPVDIVTIDPDGKLVDAKVKLEVYKIEWRYWWEKNTSEDLSKYSGSSYKNRVYETTTTTKNGSGKAFFEVKYPDWGRYYVKVTNQNSGHVTGKIIYIDWPGWAGRASKDNPGGASMLVFSADKQKYNVGEEVKVSIPSSDKGRALVSVESGTKVIKSYLIETDKETTNFSFVATAEMTPNVYINITLLQPHNYNKNDLPIRLYGMIPITVEDPDTRITPIIEMPKELYPEQNVSIKISEKQGEAMEYTVAVVDEGLLDITRFKTPNPWDVFYAREALGVRSWDMYKYVMGAYTGKISGLLKVGGDDLNSKKGGQKANRFKPVVKFLGPFKLEQGKTNTHTFKMPQYVGSVKTMIVASHENAYGKAEYTTPVRQPLMVLSTVPRVVSPKEKIKIPVTVFAMEERVKNVSVSIKTNNYLNKIGTFSKQIKFTEPGEKIIDFEVEVPEKIGKATIEIVATSGELKANHQVELDVRIPNPPTTFVKEKVIDIGQSWSPSYELNGIKGTNSVKLEVSSVPSINLEERLRYLITYPHGCVEQTTSSGFPQLFLSKISDLSDSEATQVTNNITATIDRLLQFQNYDGGFSYWPGNSKNDDWGSSYAGQFLIEAKNKGYSLPSGMLEKWINYQSKKADDWSENDERKSEVMQAYRLFTLALSGNAKLGAMNRFKERESLSTQSIWRLAGAYALANQEAVAKELIFGKETEVAPYKELSGTYGSSDRDKAMILETLILLGEKEKASNLIKDIAVELSSSKWMSTQTTAYCLLAVSKFLTGKNENEPLKFTLIENGGSSKQILSDKPILIENLKANKISNQIELINETKNILFARLIIKGTTLKDEIDNTASDLVMDINYFDLEGNKINHKDIKQGVDFKAEVTVKNPGYKGDYKEMALTQMFPSGWEIQNVRMDNVGGKHLKDIPEYSDIRDDRVNYYYNLKSGQTKTFVTLLNASYLGEFYLPAVYSEAMYDNAINAKKAGGWIKVVK